MDRNCTIEVKDHNNRPMMDKDLDMDNNPILFVNSNQTLEMPDLHLHQPFLVTIYGRYEYRQMRHLRKSKFLK